MPTRPQPQFRTYNATENSMQYLGGLKEVAALGVDQLPKEQPYMESTGLVEPSSGVAIYEDDIIAFTVRGVTHGPDPEHVVAAHIWWSTEDACWAFGRWVTPAYGSCPSYTWHYCMLDRIDPKSIKLLGNIWQNPELLPRLGYDPFAA